MSSVDAVEPDRPDAVDHDTVPPARTGLLVLAGVLLSLPVIALMWVSSYSRDEPRLGGFPFFIWYQFLWVFLTSALTYTAYRIVLVARPHRPMDDLEHRHRGRSGHEQHQRSRTVRPRPALRARHRHGLLGHPVAPPDEHGVARRVGPRWPLVRHLDHLVPARRRPLHGLHVHRGAGGDVGGGLGVRVLRGALHDRALPDHLRLHGPDVVGRATGTATSRRPTSCAAGSGRAGSPSPSRSPASSRRCRTSRSSWSASRPCSRSSASAAATASSPRTCRCSSRSPCSRPTPTRAACARRRSSRSSRTP